MGVVYVKNTPHWSWKTVIALSTVCLGYPFTPTLTLPLKGEGIWRKHRLQGYGIQHLYDLVIAQHLKVRVGIVGVLAPPVREKGAEIGQLHRR